MGGVSKAIGSVSIRMSGLIFELYILLCVAGWFVDVVIGGRFIKSIAEYLPR
jgi:hypothetical protein